MTLLSTKPLILTLGLLAIPVAYAAPSAAPAAAVAYGLDQDDEEVPDKREVVKDLIAQFDDHVKAKGKEDTEAIAVLDKLNQEFEQSGPKDRAAIVKSVDKALLAKRKDIDENVPDIKLALACAVVLGHMGPESTKPLISAATGKKLERSEALHREAILSLGKTRDEKAIKPLLELATDKDAYVQGAGVEGLGEFREADEKFRKEIVEELIKNIMPLQAAVDADSSDILARERYDVVAPPTNTTLQRLTDQNIRDFHEWQTWWNKNKREDWDPK